MNIMRKILNHREDASQMPSTDQDLSLMHLNKLFNEIKHNNSQFISGSGNQAFAPSKYDIQAQQAYSEYEQKIYKLLPLFMKVFGNSMSSSNNSGMSGSAEMFDKFADLTTFTQMVSRLMVNEIRRRASNKTTEEASLNIVNFLEIPKQNQSSEKPLSTSPGIDVSNNNHKGWILLSTLNLLVCNGSAPLITIMASTSLPSTLVKCLYLFFDLPPLREEKSTNAEISKESNDDISDKERRLLLQRVFAQLLTRLCSHQASLHELTRKDDLALLFNAFTSWCPKHNQIWRQTASDVVLIMAKSNVVNASYIHDKGCVASCIENMSRMNELSTATASEICDMISTIILFLTEVANNNPSSVSVLLDDFKSSLGYHFLVDFVLKLETSIDEHTNILCRIITLVTQFSKVGASDLKPRPLSVNQLFIMDDFSMPRPTPKQSVRNLSAFNVLQTLWLKSKSFHLQDIILSALITLYRDDRANYFILDSQNTLSQFAEKLYLKPIKIQEKFFTILEFVIYELRYVPCKELISVSIIIKSKHSLNSSKLCLRTLLSVIKFNPIFRDVYREVGLLDIITSLLVSHSQQVLNDTHTDEQELQLLELTMEITYNMLLGPSNQNCSLFHEAVGSKHIFHFLPQTNSKITKQIRKLAFLIIQQLVLSNSGEEHLANLLALMHNSSDHSSKQAPRLTLQQELSLKSSILKSLLVVLKESHRCRALFRKVGGFVYVMSVLVGMESSLKDSSEEENHQWKGIEKRKIWNVLRYVFTTLATAMRFEPANARFFSNEICPSSLTDSIRLLGCFSHDTRLNEESCNGFSKQNSNFSQIFTSPLNEVIPKIGESSSECACLIMRFLYETALDISEKQNQQSQSILKTIQTSQIQKNEARSGNHVSKRPPLLCLTGNATNESPVIVHSCVIIAMLHLIPSIPNIELRYYLMEVIRLLLKSERNQQVMCEAGLLAEILNENFNLALVNENHILHPAVQYMLERLAAQQIQPRELRCFLRLAHPLNCLPFDEIHKCKNGKPVNQREGGSIPLSRIKTLVSMTTPKDTNNQSFLHPPFVEFDMSQEGFSCLFLPSIAPSSSSGFSGGATNILAGAITGGESVSLTGNNGGVNGGIGTGERTFPPQNGLTFLTWICVEKFSSLSEEAHNTRLLIILRGSASGQEYSCLQIQISARDKALLISTQETPIFGDGDLLQPSAPISMDSDHNLRIWSPELIQESQWHHIVVVLNRALLKNSTCSVYIDGLHVTSQKLHYISSTVGGSNIMSNGNASFVNGFIGTPPQWRKQSKLVWKQGPCHLLEEPLSSGLVSFIYSLGPNYIGSFQGCMISSSGISNPHSAQQQISEDKVVFGLNARATSIMTLAKMRRVYSRFDSRQISKILGISTHENATPIYVLHNSAGHLCGPSRSLGAILIGYIGARCFIPKPVSVTLQDVGGCTLLLGLIASSHDIESLYASVKALVCVLKVNKELILEMERIKGYQTLAMLFRRKKQFLNSHVLHLTFNLVGTLDVYRKNENVSNEIQNSKAFKDLLCDQIDLWAQNDLLKSLLEHFNELLMDSGQYQNQLEFKSKNIKILRELGLLPRLLQLLWDLKVTDAKVMSIVKTLIFVMLNQTPRQCDLLYFGQFIAALLPTNGESEKSDEIVELRNSLLKIVLQLMTRNVHQQVNQAIQEELTRILGFDWFLLFLQGTYLHKDTVAIGLVNIMVLISNPYLYIRFKEASSNGGWLKDTDTVFSNRLGVQLLGFNVGGVVPSNVNSPSVMGSSAATLFTTSKSNNGVRIIRNDLFTIPGFQHLAWLMSHHVQKPQVYLILFQGLLGQFTQLTARVLDAIESFEQLNLDNLWGSLFGGSKRSIQSKNASLTCPDLTLTILSMIHTLIWDIQDADNFASYPVTLIQFLTYLYHNRKDFQSYCHTNPDFINSLTQVIIAEDKKEQGSFLLTTHPAKKFIMEFIRLIVVDSMICASTLPQSRSQLVIFELFLEAFSNCKLAQTELLCSLMEHLSSLTEVMAQQQQFDYGNDQQCHHHVTAANIILFSSILTDKLWQDCYLRDPKEILDFELKLLMRLNLPNPLNNSSNKSFNELNLIYKSLNRTVLYLLSRPLETISDRMAMLEVLQKIHSARQLILISACNSESNFFVCMTYCLLQLIDEAKISLTGKSRTTWHIPPDSGNDSSGQADEGALLIASVARKLWDEIYLSKKNCLEDTLKISLAPCTPAFGITSVTPDLSQLRETLYEPCLKIWVNYIESEQHRQRRNRMSSYLSLDSPSSASPTALITEKFSNINKLTKVVGGGAGLVSKIVGGTTGAVSGAISTAVGGSIKKDVFKTPDQLVKSSVPVWNLMSFNEVELWTLTHISIITDLVELQLKQKYQGDAHLLKYVYDDWIAAENELLVRERAIWGPDYGSRQFDKWKLDMTEGPHRMRKKLVRNDAFYLHYPYKPEMDPSDSKLPKYKLPISFDSKEYYKRFRPENNGLIERDLTLDFGPPEDEPILTAMNISQDRESSFEGIKASSLLPSKSPSTDQEDADSSGFVDMGSEVMGPGSEGSTTNDNNEWEQIETQTVLRLLEEGEKISHMFRCARILGLDVYEGLLLFGKEHFYLIDGFTLLKTREIRDIDSLPANMHDPIVPTTSPKGSGSKRSTKKVCMKFAFEDIKEVHKRRYLLQPIALEVFSMDGRNSLLVFPRKLRNKVYSRFMSVATYITDNAQDSLSGQKRNVNVESGTGILSSLIGETSVTQRWVRGEISNFQYLMHLNTLAGRSYNDLMQYPVFPWILADYTSTELDLSNPASFRDLSKPMGAQTPERLDQFKKRFKEWDDPHGETPPYHYGTFYSSAMIVASYLVRMEPFTQHFLRLQGGHFDLADRMFHSVGDAWSSASKNNMADVKELIPEFFYLPEFLLNSNRFDLGVKQNGIRLNDVILPPWAKGDTREFIRVHRAALECDYVSSHLHEWIDLIFGYKQQGPAAVEATNVFHHLFYEGNVDIYTIEDPLKKNATIGFINNFGQIPKQLFKKPHPAKKVISSNQPLTPIIPAVGLNSVLIAGSSHQEKVFIHNLDNLRPSMHPVKELRGAVGQIIHQDKTLLAVEQNKVLIPPHYNRYIAWGFADHSLRIGPYESERALYIFESDLIPPNGEILCGTVPNSRIVITAGTSSVVSVWKMKPKTNNLQLMQNLYGHTEAITCLTSSAAYGIIVSGSRDKTCIIWDLNRFLFVRQLGGGTETNLLHPAPISAVAINDLTGDIATCASTWLFLWSINGDLIASVNTLTVAPSMVPNPNQNLALVNATSVQILCVAFSLYNEWDPQNVIMTGSSDGVVRMWSLGYVQVPITESNVHLSGQSSSSSSPCTEDISTKDGHLNAHPSKDDIVRRMSLVSIKTESTKGEDDEDTSEESVSDFGDKQNEEWVEIDESSEIKNSTLAPPQIQLSHSKSIASDFFVITPPTDGVEQASEDLNDTQNKKDPKLELPKIRTSKSDTSLIDSFIFVDGSKNVKPDSVLKPGHKWICELLFRSKLTMHTAFERKDNTEPAAVTALAVSKDNRTVFVGDARGRVFSWSVSEGRGLTDHWVKDDLVESCTKCNIKFTFSERRHHCRNCGHVFCAKCSKYESPILRLKIYKPVRVCQNCHLVLQKQTQEQSAIEARHKCNNQN
ncbi:WD repeat and FYVE domain-containing protein 3-like protein [Dinothrombium tinctorium]|uniref:WD repeat and FYVE domain-containing protein 3-like protein n=1 Tax=Dinothrombium tinctorium TaxID=1965070 RepID=A0A3S3SCH5_9ACAR|nr:WD repeat and FYVE domain-containing protein 3-like protein [Dinothrombium tinctorium]